MKRIIGYTGTAVFLAVSLVYLILSRKAYLAFTEAEERLLFEPELQISADNLEEIWKQEDGEGISLWGWYRIEGERVLFSEFERTVNTDIIFLCGDTAYPENAVYPLLHHDMEGCILTSSLSWELFGSIYSTGMSLEYEDKTYIVRDVVEAEENIMYIRHSAKGKEAVIQGVSIYVDEEESGGSNSIYQLFLSRYSAGNAVMSDSKIYKRTGAFISVIVPVFMVLYLEVYLLKNTERTRSRLRKGLYAAGTVLSGVLTLTLWGIKLWLPQDMIPSRWSDFSFWAALAAGYREQLRILIQNSHIFPYKSYADGLNLIVKYSGIAGSLFFLCIVMIYFLKKDRT